MKEILFRFSQIPDSLQIATFARRNMFRQMEFGQFIEKLTARMASPLPGIASHLKMASELRKGYMLRQYDLKKANKGAVLVLIYPRQEIPHTVLIERQQYDGVHSGQISFPGGKFENSDPNLISTALREAMEEINTPPESISILGVLTEVYIPPSNFLVTPVVGFTNGILPFTPNPFEVAGIIEAEIPELKKEAQPPVINIQTGGYSIKTPCFQVNGKTVWGATGMILMELLDIL